MKLFFNYSIDCVPPQDERFGGPLSWEFAENSTLAFVDVMSEVELRQGATLFVHPDVARKQGHLFRRLADAGIETALLLDGLRYSKLKNPAWPGSMAYADQCDAIRTAKTDLEDCLGRLCLGYRAWRASANDDTFPILEELGFQWSSTSAAGAYHPQDFACWSGGWPFPYHPSPVNKLIPGALKVYEIPSTRGLRLAYANDPNSPLDLRAETPMEVIGPSGDLWRQVVAENIVEMERRNQPLRVLAGASRNTNPYTDHSSLAYHNLMRVAHFARQLAAQHVYEFTPAHFSQIRDEAVRINAF